MFNYEQFYDTSDNIKDIKAKVFVLYSLINDLLCNHDYETVNDFITGIDLYKLDTHMLIGILRITFPAKHLLINWCSVRDQVKDIIQKQGTRDINRLMRGLLDFNG